MARHEQSIPLPDVLDEDEWALLVDLDVRLSQSLDDGVVLITSTGAPSIVLPQALYGDDIVQKMLGIRMKVAVAYDPDEFW